LMDKQVWAFDLFFGVSWRSGVALAVAAVLVVAAPCLGQDQRPGMERVEAAVWRDPSWKPPSAADKQPEAAANTPDADGAVARLRQRVADGNAGVRPQATREELLESLGRIVQEAEGVRSRFPGMAAAKEASVTSAEFHGMVTEVSGAKEGVNWPLLAARYYLRIPEYAKARAHLERALQSETDGGRAAAIHFMIGLTYLRETSLDEALRRFRTVQQMFPDSDYAPRALEVTGDAYLSTFRYGDALRSYKEMLRRYPGYSRVEEIKKVVEQLSVSGAPDGSFRQRNAFGKPMSHQ